MSLCSESRGTTYQDFFSSVADPDLLELALLAPDVEVAVALAAAEEVVVAVLDVSFPPELQ
jgi:hypothetical protein